MPDYDALDAELTYRNYLRTCEMLGVEPVPRERAEKTVEEWPAALAASLPRPPTKH